MTGVQTCALPILCFEELLDNVVIDATNETTLESEYLLNENQQLEIVKKYPNAGSAKVFIRAYHPTSPNCSDLLLKKDNELRKLISSQSIECADQTRNAVMRKAIWEHFSDDLQLATTDIDITKNDAKTIWNDSVRTISKKLGLRTEASSQFEKGIDPNLCKNAADKF